MMKEKVIMMKEKVLLEIIMNTKKMGSIFTIHLPPILEMLVASLFPIPTITTLLLCSISLHIREDLEEMDLED